MTSPANNVQDVFFDRAMRKRLDISIQLINKTKLNGRIKSFDRFAVVVDHEGTD